MAGKEKAAMDRRIQDNLEDTGTNAQMEYAGYKQSRKAPISPPFFRDKADHSSPAAQRDLERGDYDAAPPMSSSSGRGAETGYRRGGKVANYCKGGKVISTRRM